MDQVSENEQLSEIALVKTVVKFILLLLKRRVKSCICKGALYKAVKYLRKETAIQHNFSFCFSISTFSVFFAAVLI